jgi:hypothetical protein
LGSKAFGFMRRIKADTVLINYFFKKNKSKGIIEIQVPYQQETDPELCKIQ